MTTRKVVDLLNRNKDSMGDRRLRLFAVACCYRIWSYLGPDGKKTVLVAERYADGLASEEELRAASKAADCAASKAAYSEAYWTAYWSANRTAYFAAYWTSERAAEHRAAEHRAAYRATDRNAERAVQADILLSMLRPKRVPTEEERAFFANPDIQGLARSIYWERQWELCGILADALEDAGCDWHDLLSELRRSDIERYRGYWPVDVVLSMA